MIQKTLSKIVDKKISDFYDSYTYSDRVFSGRLIEIKTRNILNLNKDLYYKKYSPDILDFKHEIIGEIKSVNGNNKIFLFVEQFIKYKKLKQILNNETKTFNNKKYNFVLNYYISKYSGDKIEYILKINEENLNKFFKVHLIKYNLKWNFNKPYVEITIKKLNNIGIKIYDTS